MGPSFKKRRSLKRNAPRPPDAERRRRIREVILILLLLGMIILLTWTETRVIRFGTEFPISNTILMFILININLLLLILLIFLVFRNLAKLLYDRKHRVMGSRLRTRLVVAFVFLTIFPTGVLFFFSVNFISSSIEFWFNVPVEQALENSLGVGRRLYQYFEDHNRFFLERIAREVRSRDLLEPGQRDALRNYAQVVQRAFNLEAVEFYATQDLSERKTNRLALSLAPKFGEQALRGVSPQDLRGEPDADGVYSYSEMIPRGELARSLARIPFGASLEDARGFVVLSFLIPPGFSEDLDSIARGVDEYRQTKMLKEPIRLTYYVIISIVALMVLFCAIFFGLYLAKSISIPIKGLAEGTRRVAEGDLTFTIGRVGDDELGSLVDSFNKMTTDLRASREQLELSASMLREQNTEIEERRRYMEIVLKNISTGVITLDAEGHIATMNTSAEEMLDIEAEEVMGKSHRSLLRGQHLDLAKTVMEEILQGNSSVEFPLRLSIEGAPRSFRVNVNSLRDDRRRHLGIVMVFDDLTELERAQRMAAWREVARRIAHEVKNPLTPIKLSAERLHRRYSRRLEEPVFEECTRMIIDHVDLIRNLVNEFSEFAKFPAANPKPCDLSEIIDETVALFREGHPDVLFDIRIDPNLPILNLDRQQIKQAMINLVTNAIGAVKAEGTVSIAAFHDPDLSQVVLEVADDGPGLSDEVKARLFEPYFSTKRAGMGLGLTIVSSIISDHHGNILVLDNQPQGAKFIIELPV